MTEYQGMIKYYFAALGRFFLLFVVRPVALLFGALVSSIYRVFFAWVARRSDLSGTLAASRARHPQ
jgi:hypothetical protein